MTTRLGYEQMTLHQDSKPAGLVPRRLGVLAVSLMFCLCGNLPSWAEPPAEETPLVEARDEKAVDVITTEQADPETATKVEKASQKPAFEIKLPEGPFIHVERDGKADRAAIELLKAAIRGEKVMTDDPMIQSALRMIAKTPLKLPTDESLRDATPRDREQDATRAKSDKDDRINLTITEPQTARGTLTLRATIEEHKHDGDDHGHGDHDAHEHGDHAHDDHEHGDHDHEHGDHEHDHAHDDHDHDHGHQATRSTHSLFILTPDGKRQRVLLTQPGVPVLPDLKSEDGEKKDGPQRPRSTYQPSPNYKPRAYSVPSNKQPGSVQIYPAPRPGFAPPTAMAPPSPAPGVDYRLAESLLRSARLLEEAGGNPGREQLIRQLRAEASTILRGGPSPRAVYPVPYTPKPTPPQGRSPVPSLPPPYPPTNRPKQPPKPHLLDKSWPSKPERKN